MIVGLTGGIGSGKSTVAKMFELLGCAVFNSDSVAKEVYFDESLKPKIEQLLGKECYISDKEINKKYISSKIFTDTHLLHQLNAIIHPEVIKKFKIFSNMNNGKLIIKETALLFEAKLQDEVDKIILVVAENNLRITRIVKRDGLTHEAAKMKLAAQLPQEDKILKSDFVIYNNEDDFLIEQILSVYKDLKFRL